MLQQLAENSLEGLQRCSLEGVHLDSYDDEASRLDSRCCACFALESYQNGFGMTALVYRQPTVDSAVIGQTYSKTSPGSKTTDSEESEEQHGSSKATTNSSTTSPSRQGSYRDPEVWFQDKSSRWHFVCATFTQYVRLAVVHFGVLGWQMAFTPEGLSRETQQWMRLVCPERLCVDKAGACDPDRAAKD